MSKCLVKKLSAEIDNDSLPIFKKRFEDIVEYETMPASYLFEIQEPVKAGQEIVVTTTYTPRWNDYTYLYTYDKDGNRLEQIQLFPDKRTIRFNQDAAYFKISEIKSWFSSGQQIHILVEI